MDNQEPVIEIREEKPDVKIETPKKCCNKKQLFLVTINVLAFIGVIVLFVLFLTSKKNENNTPPKSIDNVSFAFVNTDTIWDQYDFVLDVQVDLATIEKNYQNQYAAAVNNFQKEYNEYLKKGTAGMLSLAEQKATEEKLAKKQQDISEMEAKLSQQLLEEKTKRNQEVHDTIVNHIARYNKSKNYTFIFEKSFAGTLLFANPALDITKDILTGLNSEYEKIVKEKKAETEKE